MSTSKNIDPIELTQKLVRCPSITPKDAGALDVLEDALKGLGFECHRLVFESKNTPTIDNLYAKWGEGAPHLAFAGHTDVVPVGDEAHWNYPPFDGVVKDDFIEGRGTSDMKGAIAAFVSAAGRYINNTSSPKGTISFIITGDEEGPAINGTIKMLNWLEKKGGIPTHCIVGEPTNPNKLGETIKIGRRGSLNGKITVNGIQGHVAYPHKAENPIPKLMEILSYLPQGELDKGTDDFSPTNLEVTAIETDANAYNVIPGRATAIFNSRFNTNFSGLSLQNKIRESLKETDIDFDLQLFLKGESFLVQPEVLAKSLQAAIKTHLGVEPEFSTSGGTSDARFIKNHCPLVEFGLVGNTMHSKNERVALKDIQDLTEIYYLTIEDMLQKN